MYALIITKEPELRETSVHSAIIMILCTYTIARSLTCYQYKFR